MRESFGMMGTYQYVEMAEDEGRLFVSFLLQKGLAPGTGLALVSVDEF